jgi:Tol biopolymer transport system component
MKNILKYVPLFYLVVSLPSLAQTYPPQTTSLEIGTMPALARPGYLGSITEPALGTRITRVVDQQAFGTTQRVVAHSYPTMETWNCDGTMMMITQGQYPYVFIDGNNYTISGRYRPPQGATWSPTQPNIMYGIRSSSPTEKNFVSYDVRTGAFTYLKTFDAYTGLRYSGEYHVSNDDKYTCLLGYKGENLYLISFDISRREIIAERLLGRLAVGDDDPNGVNAIMMSQRGNFILVVYKTDGPGATQGVHLYDRNLNYLRRLVPISHSDMGLDENGDEVLVTQTGESTQRAICKIRLRDNEKTIVWDDAKMGYNQHISCRNIRRPGWAYVSDFEAGYAARPNENKIFAVKLDGSQTIEIYAWARRSETIEYDRSVMVSPSPDGSKVVFRSDWGDGSPNAVVYSYVANANPISLGTITASGEQASNALKLHPNPANREVVIDVSGFEGESVVQVKVRDMNGKLFVGKQVQTSRRKATLSVGHLPQGIFVVTVQGSKTTKSAKLVITK